MHIPDGMLEARTWVPAWLGSAGVIAYAARVVRRRLTDGTIVLMAVMAALVFALQMLNFPVAGGTSGHFAGGAAAAIVLGPLPAILVISAVLAVQALFFGDGGITALGANIVNLAIAGPLVGWGVYRFFASLSTNRTVRLAGAFAAAWTACVAGALLAGAMLYFSGRAGLIPALGAMGFWHTLIGVGEGIITAGLVGYLLAVRPDLLAEANAKPSRADVRRVVVALGLVAVLAAGVSFLASASPDGLEYVYHEMGVGRAFEEVSLLPSPMPDYVLPGIANETLAGALAGVVGVILTGALAYAGVSALRKRAAVAK